MNKSTFQKLPQIQKSSFQALTLEFLKMKFKIFWEKLENFQNLNYFTLTSTSIEGKASFNLEVKH